MDNSGQNDLPLAVNVQDLNKRNTAQLLPRFFRSDSNQKFLGGTLDRLTTPGKLTRINGYVGRRDIPNFDFDDTYVVENSVPRTYYQLENAFVNENPITNEVRWYGDYIDYINSLKYFGAPVGNHSRLNSTETYSWNPHINWDKIVNFREYYWLPNGPDPITIFGELEATASTFTIVSQDQGDTEAYVFSPDGLTVNPRLTLYRGLTYRFEIDAIGKPFCIKTQPTVGDSFFYNTGISGQRIDNGVIEFQVPFEAPDLLYYIDNNDPDTAGIIDIRDIEDSAFLDVEAEIVGKKNFVSSTGIEFVNGLKIKFEGQVTPSKYSTGFWYVEGVGTSIKLVDTADLETPAVYGANFDVPFDDQPFDSLPWDNADNYPQTKDYIVIDRASIDRNTWSRNNRWFHRNVIETTARANGTVASPDQSSRAIRPIIEFEPNIKLYANGYISKKDIDLVDTFTTDVFSTIEGSTGYIVDGETILPGYRILFAADTDILVNGKIFEVKNIFNANTNKMQITLVEVSDTDPQEGEVVYVTKGNSKGQSYYYEDGKWHLAQKKNSVNQPPLFDLFDDKGISFANKISYPFNSFNGNRVFGYKVATNGPVDSELGFPLTYRNINNIGDIEFEFDLQTKNWSYQDQGKNVEAESATAFLRKYDEINTSFSYSNGWIFANRKSEQRVARILRIEQETDLVAVDVFDDSASLPDLNLRVYVNDKKRNDVSLEFINGVAYVKFASPLQVNDKVVYKARSLANKNSKGYYEIPSNWQNNPLNNSISAFTFGEVTDHVKTIVENLPTSEFSGDFPGASNLNDIGSLSQYGRRFLQHAGPFGLAAFSIIDKDANIIKSIRWTARKYSEFKREFLRIAEQNPFDGTISEIVDQILLKYSEAKHSDTFPFYYSDMAPYGAASVRTYTVVDPRLPIFVIDQIFDPSVLTKRTVLIYVNETQLLIDKDYVFDKNDAFVEILTPLSVGDQVLIKDYASTDGCYIPHTPSKMGLYPVYEPQIYVDDTYREPTLMIQGHDGSLVKAYGDFRDELILELEKRIFNTKRTTYDPNIFDINSVLGSYYRRGEFTRSEINNILLTDFLKWNSNLAQNFTSNDFYVQEDTFTYNYGNSLDPQRKEPLYGFWRGIYKYFYDTDRPHTHPWEMQGFYIKPTWWEEVYGPAPYTSENKILWDSIEQGQINDPENTRIVNRYARPGLSAYLPVDDRGNLLSPLDANLAQEFSLSTATGSFKFADQAPVETAWRRSSEYPYAITVLMCVLKGAEFIGKMWDRLTIKRNIAGQIYFEKNGKRVQTSTLPYPNIPLGDATDPTSPLTITQGLVNFIDEFVFAERSIDLNYYKGILSGLDTKLSYRLGGFTSKQKIKVLLDSRSPNASGTIFLPEENYKIFYNKSAPVETVNYSGVIIEKLGSSYEQWQPNKRYVVGKRVVLQKDIYRCISTHLSNNDGELDDTDKFAVDSQNWVKESVEQSGFRIVGYDNERNYFEIYQPLVSANDTSINIGGISESFVIWSANVSDPDPSISSEEKQEERSRKFYLKGQIAKVGDLYYRAIISHSPSESFNLDLDKWQPLAKLPLIGGRSALRRKRFDSVPVRVPYGTVLSDIQSVVDFLFGYQARLKDLGFDFDDYSRDLKVPLDWSSSAKEFLFWTLQNWEPGSIITLSPSASNLKFTPRINAAVDDLNSEFYEYSIFKADGQPLNTELSNVVRKDSGFSIKPTSDTEDGVYHVRANLVYKEHVLLVDNRSIFNDVIYDVVPGYRQGRIKLVGFKTSNWDGGFTTPGFLYDDAKIQDWQPNNDYNLGDIVGYKSYYFSAVKKVLGKSEFEFSDWKQLDNKPTAGLIPNFDYKVEQFRDFYSLEASNFDDTQTKLARHLIGYEKRKYLDEVIVDDVSQFKFYQGFIKEKGSNNSVIKLFDALRSSGISSVDVKEEWAFKVGDYGASDAFVEIDFPLDEEKFLFNPQNVVLTPNIQNFEDFTIYNVNANMVSIKPSSYDSNPFVLKKIDPNQTDYGIFKYRVAGYVREDDINHIIYNEAALLNYDTAFLNEGDRIWLGNKSNNDWDVLRVTNTKLTIINWTIEENTIILECNLVPNIEKDDIIVLRNLESIDGTYKVQRVYNNFIEIFTFNNSVFKLEEDSTTGILIKLESIRFDTPEQLAAKRYNQNKIRGEKVWIDKDQTDRWLVLENIDAFSESELPSPSKIINQQFGYDVKISDNKLWMVVSAPTESGGKVFVYNRPNNISKWTFVQSLFSPSEYITLGNELFGNSVDIVENGSLIVISAPNASNLKSYFKGNFNPAATYFPNDIVKYDNRLWKNLNSVVGDGSTITVESQDWEETFIYEGSRTGSNTSGITNQGVVFVYEYSPISSRYVLQTVLGSYDPVANEKFGSKVRITYDGTDTWLFVSSKNYNIDTGRVHIFKKNSSGWQFNSQRFLDFTTILGSYPSIYAPTTGSQYGYDLDCTQGASRVAVSAPFLTGASGGVYIFNRFGSIFELIQVIDKYTLDNGITQNLIGGDSYITPNDYFGYSIKLSSDKLFISAPNDDIGGYNAGSVYYFDSIIDDSSGNPFRLRQLIRPPSTFDNERFGAKIGLNPSENILVVSAIGGDSVYESTFDNYADRTSLNNDSTRNYELDQNSEKLETSTTFDRSSTKFYDRIPYTGAVYIFNGYDQSYIYADKLRPSADLESNDNFGFAVSVSDNCLIIGTPNKLVRGEKIGTVFVFDYTNLSWNTISSQNELVDISKFKKALVYNSKENELIANLDFIDPAKGKIAGIADQEIKYQTYYDPAVYEYGIELEVAVDKSGRWSDNHIGELWWDLSKVKWIWYEQGDSTYRNNNWGKIFPGSTIDVYEWVESTYQPSRWAQLADTEEGLALGISGSPKDPDDFTYSTKFKYDPISGSRTTLYYFWVRNKTTVPRNSFRVLSAADVARLILDPKSQGYRYIAITNSNSLSLTNISNRLINTDISLNVQFYTIENTNLLTHREYALIAKDDRFAKIPQILETKWFDSLAGMNSKGQLVPDKKLNQKQRYGTANSPRQSWFVNRFEALKQLFEYVNGILKEKQVVDEINFANLSKKDLPPALASNASDIDAEIDILDDLRFVGVSNLKTATVTVSILEGKISNVFIVDGGLSYGRNKVYEENINGDPIKWYGPKLRILGTGSNAEIISVVNNQGTIIEAHIIRSGKDYDASNTTISVRAFSVLVKSDQEANNGWSIQSWDSAKKRWFRTKTQAYDVTRYWKYRDWYASGYGLESDIAYLVDRTVDLNGLPAVKGDIVKVQNVANGTWLLLERTAVTGSPNFTDDYMVVGKQNATIEFSNALYNQNSDIGFDVLSSFDLSPYDQNPTTELRIILESLRDDVLVDDLRIEYIRAFFNSVHYVFSEQVFVDWAFKTSFLKINHSVGSLKKRTTFQSDVLDSYQSYIEEAKPYKSKIREFVSSYERVEESNHLITDFDLPSYYYSNLGRIERVTQDSEIIETYPWKNWLDNHTYEVVDIVIQNQGSNYTSRPKVIISGGDLDLTNPQHRPAKATAYVANRKIYKIIVDDPGYGYKSTPTVFISGGNGDVEDTRAAAYAVIGNSKVRTNHITMKYDRYSSRYEVNDFKYQNTFVGTGSRTSFKLTYAPEIEKTKINVVVDSIEYYGSQYEVSIVQATHGTYSAYEGSIIFKTAPVAGAQIVITYNKNIRLYSAADRINYAYNPKSGQYGKDLGQLMSGVDYGGTVLTSISFEVGGGWDVLPWDVSSWDNTLTSNDDYLVASDGTTKEFELPYIPTAGEVINIYLNNVRIDDFYYDLYDGSTVQPNGRTTAPENTVMNSFVGNGVDNTITIPVSVDLLPSDILTFRKSTSDGTILPTDRSLIDSLISGGDLAYTSARGIAAEEIIVDGDKFVTSDTSHGPEELVQGQVVDALDIKVYHTPSSGGPNVVVRNYIGNGTNSVYEIGQLPSTNSSLFVIVDDVITDYTVDMATQTVTISPTPAIDSRIGIISLDTAGYDILDKVVFYGDGSTKEFLTAAPYAFDLTGDSSRNVSAFVTLDGTPSNIILKESDNSYEAAGYTIVEFDTAPAIGTIIQVMVFAGNIQKWSQVTTQTIAIVPGQFDYNLSPLPEFSEPLGSNLFVVVDGEFLQSPDYEHFVYNGSPLIITDVRYQPNSLSLPLINVYKNRVKLMPAQDYSLDSASNTITLSPNVAVNGDEIILEIYKFAHFQITSGKLIISNTNYSISSKQTIKVTTFTNHDILKTKISNSGFRTYIDSFVSGYSILNPVINMSGVFDLPRTVSNTSGVFVALSKVLLTPNIDYVVLDNKRQIKVLLPEILENQDYIEIITFNDQTVRPSFGFKIFKDMVNRYHYKRLDDESVTVLKEPLSITDTKIVVHDASKLSEPSRDFNLPGVVEIQGERIEYFVREGNVLRQLRRATLGTGAASYYDVGTSVKDIGQVQSIPYVDTEIKKTFFGDGSTNLFELDFVVTPTAGTIDDGSTEYRGWYRETIPDNFGQCDEIEVFVAGRRLRKTPSMIYDSTLGQDSYQGAGDKQIEAEFSVSIASNAVRFTVAPNPGDRIVVVKKQGRVWQKLNENNSLVYSNVDVARFLTAKSVTLPK